MLKQTHLLALNVLLNGLLALNVAGRNYFVLYLLKFKESEFWLNTTKNFSIKFPAEDPKE